MKKPAPDQYTLTLRDEEGRRMFWPPPRAGDRALVGEGPITGELFEPEPEQKREEPSP